MENKTMLKALIIWAFFIPMAIINGFIRNFVYGPFVPEHPGRDFLRTTTFY